MCDKGFEYDFEVMYPGSREGISLLGLFLIGIAVIYPGLLKVDKKLVEDKKKDLEEKRQVIVID